MKKLTTTAFNYFTQLKRQPFFIATCVLILFFISLELAGWLSIHMLNGEGYPQPSTVIQVSLDGFPTAALIAFLLSTLFIIGIITWCFGGVSRTFGKHLLMGLIGFALANWLAVYGYIYWEGFDLTPYPWLTVYLYYVTDPQSLAYKHYLLCFGGSYFLFLGALIVPLLTDMTQAKKIHGNAHFATSLEIKKAGLFSEEGVVLGKAYGKILRSPGFESVLITAPTGSGKTTSIAIPNLIEWRGSIVVNDIKGELHSLTADYRRKQGNQVYCFAPANTEKQTHKYNPFAYVNSNPDLRIRDIQLIAETLIPATQLGDAFWYQSSREILIMLAIYLFESKGMATLGEIHDLSKRKDFFQWLLLIVDNGEINSLVFSQSCASIIGADEKTKKNIMKDFHSRVALFTDPLIKNATNGNDFDLTKLRQQKMTIYLNIPISDMERLSPILTLFWRQCLQVMTQKEPDFKKEPHGVLALIDEFGLLAKIPALQKGMSFLRSYRIRCVPIVQYLGQIISTYGREDAKGFINTKIKIAFTLNDSEDAAAFSKAMGKKTVKVHSTSRNSGHGDNPGTISRNINFQSKPLMTPDEFMQMSKKQAVILVEGGMPIKVNKCFWFKQLKYRHQLM